jgi:ParB family chromosome partitioning protein
LNVRQTEELVAHLAKTSAGLTQTKAAAGAMLTLRDTHVANLENKLRERLGTKVQVRYREGKGSLDIRFFSDAELERILQILGVKVD